VNYKQLSDGFVVGMNERSLGGIYVHCVSGSLLGPMSRLLNPAEKNYWRSLGSCLGRP
jgi:hypothetical protein